MLWPLLPKRRHQMAVTFLIVPNRRILPTPPQAAVARLARGLGWWQRSFPLMVRLKGEAEAQRTPLLPCEALT